MRYSLDELARLARVYRVRRKEPTRLLRELSEAIGVEYLNWSGPYDRGYQYEFCIERSPEEASLIVEISDVAPVACVCFGYQTNNDPRTIRCRDAPDNEEHSRYQDMAKCVLESHGYELLSLDQLSQKYGGKTLKELLIYDPDD